MPPSGDACVEQAVLCFGVPQQRAATASEDVVNAGTSDPFCSPLLRPTIGLSMAAFFEQLRPMLDTQHFASVATISDDGLYLHKRHIRGHHGKMLEQAGTVLLHTLLYLKSGDKIVSLDFGPVGEADVTANLMEAVPCGPILQDPAEIPEDTCGLPFLHIKVPHHPASSDILSQALQFCHSQQYHAFANNCMQNTDFLVRTLTGGQIRNAPLVYDELCGSVPPQDNPMLLMFMLMTRISWFDVCDGSRLAAAFAEKHGKPPRPEPLC